MAPKKKISYFPKRRHCGSGNRRIRSTNCKCNNSFPHRINPRTHRLNIAELVYKFLGNVASMSAVRRQQKNAQNNFNRTHVRRSRYQHRRPNNPGKLGGMFDSPRLSSDNQILPICMDSSASTPPKSSTDKKATMMQRSSIQVIRDYIKAGIEEGKRRAKKYVWRALSFGVDSGYLIPADTDGQVLRVSSALVEFGAQQRDDEKQKRRTLRKGARSKSSQERRSLRGKDSSRSRKRARSRSQSNTSPQQSPRRRKRKVQYKKRIRKHKSRQRIEKARRRRRKAKERGLFPPTKDEEPYNGPEPDPDPGTDESKRSRNGDDDDEQNPKAVPVAPPNKEKMSDRQEDDSNSSDGEHSSVHGDEEKK